MSTLSTWVNWWKATILCSRRFRERSDAILNHDDVSILQDNLERGSADALGNINPIYCIPRAVEDTLLLSGTPQHALAEGNNEASLTRGMTVSQSASEILDLFRQEHLSIEVAHRLTDPNGTYGFSDLVQFCKHITEQDLRSAGLHVAPARELLEKVKPGGSIHMMLRLQQRLPLLDVGNPNDGSNSSDRTSSSGNTSLTEMTTVMVPQRVRDNVEGVIPQLYHQHKLSEKYKCNFSTLPEASSHALAAGDIGQEEAAYLKEVNNNGNIAKHEAFGQDTNFASRRHVLSSNSASSCAQPERLESISDGPQKLLKGKCGPRECRIAIGGHAPQSVADFVGSWRESLEGAHV